MNNDLVEPTVQDITRRAETIAQRPLTPPTEAELRARLHTDEQVITALRAQVAELTAENASLKRERTAVRKELGDFYCPLYPDTAEGQDLENSDSLWLDQGVNLATLWIKQLTQRVKELEDGLRPFAEFVPKPGPVQYQTVIAELKLDDAKRAAELLDKDSQ